MKWLVEEDEVARAEVEQWSLRIIQGMYLDWKELPAMKICCISCWALRSAAPMLLVCLVESHCNLNLLSLIS
jgi:hypothetical protein